MERIYTRGSDDRVNTDNQLSELLPRFPNAKVYADIMSGAKKRPELERLIEECESGDTVGIWSLDRLSRQGAYETLHYLKRFTDKGVRVVSLKETWLDTAGPCFEMMVCAISFAAKMERDRLIERVTTARRNGMAKRGKTVLDRKAIAMAEGTALEVAERFGCNRQYVYQCKREYLEKL